MRQKKLNQVIQIRISQADKDLLTAYADSIGFTPGTFMREFALKAAREATQEITDGQLL